MRFSYDAGGNVAAMNHSDDYGDTFTTYYYIRNAQGDIVKLIDGNGSTVVEYTYDSWGKIITTTGSLSNSLGKDQPFRYRGYVYDIETQWYYLQSRYYDPTICRFISADVYLSTGQGVIGNNSFAYCLNNPVISLDVNGEIAMPWSWLPYWGFVHKAVQIHILENAKADGRFFEMEKQVNVGPFYGFIDIYERRTGKMWEVKPAGSGLLGAAQLCWYSAGVVKNTTAQNAIGDYIRGDVFTIGKITIEYHYVACGVIEYTFFPTLDYVPEPVPVPLPSTLPPKAENLFKKRRISIPVYADAGLGFGFALGGCGGKRPIGFQPVYCYM